MGSTGQRDHLLLRSLQALFRRVYCHGLVPSPKESDHVHHGLRPLRCALRVSDARGIGNGVVVLRGACCAVQPRLPALRCTAGGGMAARYCETFPLFRRVGPVWGGFGSGGVSAQGGV